MHIYKLYINNKYKESILSEEKLNEDDLFFKISQDVYADKYILSEDEFKAKYKFKLFQQNTTNLYLVITSISGYDTFDSAVISAWTEEEAYELSIEKMGPAYKDNVVELIGVSNFKNSEIIVASFNAG